MDTALQSVFTRGWRRAGDPYDDGSNWRRDPPRCVMSFNTFFRVLVPLALAIAAPFAQAAEIALLSGGAVEPGLKPVLAAFQAATGHIVKVTFNAAPQIEQRIEAGEAWDVVIAPVARLERYGQAGKVGPERVGIGRVGLGIAIRP